MLKVVELEEILAGGANHLYDTPMLNDDTSQLKSLPLYTVGVLVSA